MLKLYNSVNRLLIFIFFTFLTVYQSCSPPITAVSSNAIEACGIKLYHAQTSISPGAQSVFKGLGVGRILLVVEKYIEGAREGEVDVEKLENFIISKVPYAKDDLLIVLDWEGPIMKILERGNFADNLDYEAAAKAYQEAYRTVKKLRPNSIVGFYRFPVRNYHNRGDKWKMVNRSLDTLFATFDALFPSVYDFYDTGSKDEDLDLAYVRDNIQEALKAGNRLNKPIYPFVWHRYHPSNKEKPEALIPINEFKAHVREVANARVDGAKVKGIIWWGSDFVRFARLNKQLSTNALRWENWKKEGDVELPIYLRAFHQAVTESCRY